MTREPELRPATAEDLRVLFGFYRTAFRSHIDEIWGWDEAWQHANFRKDFDASSTSVVEVDGHAVGFVQTVDDPERLVLRLIALTPDTQGRGIGTLLITNLQEEARQRGVRLDLVVFRTNHRACTFYERLGFLHTGRTDDFIEMSWLPS